MSRPNKSENIRRHLKSDEQIGERKIIEIIQNHLESMPKMPIPFGDDVSAYDLGKGNLAILKTDMLVDKTDVPKGMTLLQAARKAIVMNVSDFAAKGVKPLVFLVSLGLPRNLARNDIEEIGKGLNAAAREYAAYVVGGDTGEASDIIISISVFGIAKKNKVTLRSGARPGDIVAVTGPFGKTSAGLKILLDGQKASRKIREELLKSVLSPQAHLAEGLALSRIKAATASIDSSDGLAWSLHELARASHVGFLIDRLPVADEAKEFAKINGIDPLELVLYGGEEYELIITIRPRLWRRAQKAVARIGGRLLGIGKATAEEQIFLKIDGKKSLVEPRGYEHFRSLEP